MLKISKIYNSVIIFILWIIIPTILLCFWVIGALFANPFGGVTTLLYPYSNKEYIKLPKNNLFIKNEKVIGEFISQEDNLGIIGIQINNGVIPNSERPLYMQFLIREKGSHDWYYERIAYIGSVKEDDFLVFGFPKIISSKNKIYEFELISLNGDKVNAISFAMGYDSFLTRHIYVRSQIKENKAYISLGYKKLLSVILYPKIFFSTSLFMLPLIFYILFLSLYTSRHIVLTFSKLASKQLNNRVIISLRTNPLVQIYLRKSFLGSFTITLIIADIFLIRSTYYGITLGLLGFWITAVIKDKLSLRISLIFAGLCIFLSEIDIASNFLFQENKSAMWAYFFIIIGVTQMIWKEIYKKNEISTFVKKVRRFFKKLYV